VNRRRPGPVPFRLHGTEARARRHYRDGEKPCQACLAAARQAWALRAQARKERAGA
jgi:hypothetical protein